MSAEYVSKDSFMKFEYIAYKSLNYWKKCSWFPNFRCQNQSNV